MGGQRSRYGCGLVKGGTRGLCRVCGWIRGWASSRAGNIPLCGAQMDVRRLKTQLHLGQTPQHEQDGAICLFTKRLV